jgi:hypothetical protein
MTTNIIYSYTREQAIEDGVLVDVSKEAREAGISIPVAVTAAAYNDYIEWTDEDTKRQTYQDTNGRLWDVIWMLSLAIRANRNTDQLMYELRVVPRGGRGHVARRAQLKAILSGGDNGEPVITVMLPNED